MTTSPIGNLGPVVLQYAPSPATSSAGQAAASTSQLSLVPSTTPAASGNNNPLAFLTGQSDEDNAAKKKEFMQALQRGEVRSIKMLLDPYKQVPFYKISYELNSGEKGLVKIALQREIEHISVLCEEHNINMSEDTPGPADWMRDYGRDASIQLLAPLALSLISWMGLKFYKKFEYKGKLRESIIKDPSKLIESKDIFDLKNIKNRIVGVPEIHRFAAEFNDYMEQVRAGKGRDNFGGILSGAAGCGKTTTAVNAARMLHAADPNSSVIKLNEAGALGAVGQALTGLNLEQRAKLILETVIASGKKRVIFVVDDQEKEGGQGALTNTVNLIDKFVDLSKPGGICTNSFVTTNSVGELAYKTADSLSSTLRRLGQVYRSDSFSKDDIKQQFAYYFSRTFGRQPSSELQKAFVKIDSKHFNDMPVEDILYPVLIEGLVKLMKSKHSSATDKELINYFKDKDGLLRQLINTIKGSSGKYLKNDMTSARSK
jgi:hypothetical protein